MDDKLVSCEIFWRRSKRDVLPVITLSKPCGVAPAGFVSDGASRPWWLRVIIRSIGPELYAVIQHDFRVEKVKSLKEWNHVADLFLDDMSECHISKLRAYLYFYAVKLHGLSKMMRGHFK